MRVGIVTTWLERGAAYVSRQYQQALYSEHDVYIYARAGEHFVGDNSLWGGKVTHGKPVPFGPLTSFNLKEFRKWLVSRRIELVLFNEQHWWTPVVLCNEMGIKTGAYVDYYTEETVPLFACYDFLVCNTRRHLSVFAWHKQCIYIPWGTDLQVFKPKPLSDSTSLWVTFFHSCGFSPRRKGTDLVIMAFSKLQQNARLVIHSQIDLLKALPDCVPAVQQLEGSGKLEIRQLTVGVPGLYYLGDVYVYPSRLEGIGLTVVEALACGLPVIAPNNPPMAEFVLHASNGMLVPIDRFVSRPDGYYWPQCIVNPTDLTQAMAFYCENKSELPRFKRQARESAEENFDWARNARGLPEWLCQVVKNSGESSSQANRIVKEYEHRRSTIVQRHPRLFLPLVRFIEPFRSQHL